ncbi:hypothetical protein OS493_007112 [Desmophyllum pertusum]|uniref:Uncharacterized protein n=1 Tax=Desmophyllum pertusum TaxID=174260 RepID=A0A9W9ZIR8_9CNID|nr:hypothetical protein OS493_007112 [Desmophyllum pertusum]
MSYIKLEAYTRRENIKISNLQECEGKENGTIPPMLWKDSKALGNFRCDDTNMPRYFKTERDSFTERVSESDSGSNSTSESLDSSPERSGITRDLSSCHQHVAWHFSWENRTITNEEVLEVMASQKSRHLYSSIQYRFEGEPCSFDLLPHGNSKTSQSPYVRVNPSTMQLLKEETDCVTSARKAYHNVEKKGGGLTGASAVSQLPRNTKQVYNVKSSKTKSMSSNREDALYRSLNSMEMEGDDERFHQQFIKTAGTATHLLFNRRQALDQKERSIWEKALDSSFQQAYRFRCANHLFNDVREKARQIGLPRATVESSIDELLVRDRVISENAEVAGFPQFGKVLYTQNVSESGNAMLKNWTEFKEKDVDSFILDLKELVTREEDDVARALVGLDSPYEVLEEFLPFVSKSADHLINPDLSELERKKRKAKLLSRDFSIVLSQADAFQPLGINDARPQVKDKDLTDCAFFKKAW